MNVGHASDSAPGQSRDATVLPENSALDRPIPMSMPSILINPRPRHVAPQERPQPRARPAPQAADSRTIGRRRLRRSENSRFASNAHIVRPSPSDYTLVANHVATKFAEPDCPIAVLTSVPDYTSPMHSAPCFDRDSAICGQFNMSLADARQFLRTRTRGSNYATAVGRVSLDTAPLSPMEKLIAVASSELDAWINQTVHLRHTVAPRTLVAHGENGLVELRRTPNALVWGTGDGYSRMAVHCIARVRDCPSYSRTVTTESGPPQRHTWILHPNPLMRGSRRRTAPRPMHRRGSSSGTLDSSASSNGAPAGRMPLAAGILDMSEVGIHTPPETEVELSDAVTDVETDSLSGLSELDTHQHQ